ncbi:MAG: hypothetical protein OXT67_03290 [Zetaproteobacteria bacterium]|nr:hypothetical protein [Zetaproteobacteria bacterium]
MKKITWWCLLGWLISLGSLRASSSQNVLPPHSGDPHQRSQVVVQIPIVASDIEIEPNGAGGEHKREILKTTITRVRDFFNQNNLLSGTIRSLPFARYIIQPFRQPTWRRSVKVAIMDVSMMGGMLGFHYVIPPHQSESSHGGHGGAHGGNHQMPGMGGGHEGDPHVAEVEPLQVESDSGHGDIDFGRLFIGMEVGMQVGHIAALFINRLLVDPAFDYFAGSEEEPGHDGHDGHDPHGGHG